MPYVGIRCQFCSHFYQMNLFSLLTEMNRAFTSSKSATKNNYLICNLFFFEIVIIDDDYVVTIQPLDWRNKRLGSDCYD